MGKNKTKGKQETMAQEPAKELSFEVVDEEPQVDQDDEWLVPGNKVAPKTERKPLVPADTKKAQPAVQEEPQEVASPEDAKKSKNQIKKEKKAEKEALEKKAQEEAAKNASKKKKADAKKDAPAPAAPAKGSPEPKDASSKSPKKKAPEPVVKEADKKKDANKKEEEPKSKKQSIAPTFKETAKNPEQDSEESARARRDRKQPEFSPSPSPDAMRGGKRKGKPEREFKDKRRGDRSDGEEEQGGLLEWIKKNWKTTLIISVVIILFIWIKMKEDDFNRMSMNTTEQAKTVF